MAIAKTKEPKSLCEIMTPIPFPIQMSLRQGSSKRTTADQLEGKTAILRPEGTDACFRTIVPVPEKRPTF
jgi:hypothetical protein